MAHLVVVEDDETIGDLLTRGLQSHGHDVRWARTGQAALRWAAQIEVDLLLLDLMLPDYDGLELCRQLRAQQPGSVLVILTAKVTEMAVVVGLEAGADDYLTKPFRYRELLARIHAHLRRGASQVATRPHVLEIGDLEIDLAARRCTCRGHELCLRAKEFDLLARLASDPDTALSRQTLMTEVWDEHWFGPTKTLDVHVAALRNKLAQPAEQSDRPLRLPSIVTLRGYGYRLQAPD